MAPPAAVAVVPAVADLPVLALAQVVAHRVQLPLLALLLLLLAKAHLPVPAVGPVVVALAVLVVEREVLQHLRSRRSSSAAMASNTT